MIPALPLTVAVIYGFLGYFSRILGDISACFTLSNNTLVLIMIDFNRCLDDSLAYQFLDHLSSKDLVFHFILASLSRSYLDLFIISISNILLPDYHVLSFWAILFSIRVLTTFDFNEVSDTLILSSFN